MQVVPVRVALPSLDEAVVSALRRWFIQTDERFYGLRQISEYLNNGSFLHATPGSTATADR